MKLDDICNYLQVSDTISSSGQPLAEQFPAIADAGFRVVINLAMPDSDNALADEVGIVTGLGMRYHHIPVPFAAPDISHLHEFSRIMEDHDQTPVWIHCALNYRVSAFLFLWLLSRGQPRIQASKAMLPGWEPDSTWQAFISKYS